MVKIIRYLDPRLITFLDIANQTEALETLVDLVDRSGRLPDKGSFLQAVFEREKLVSTGIGMGVALPHAKQSSFRDFFIAIGILKKGIDWQALDDAPVRIIFLIGGPADKQTEYLQLLSSLTTAIENEEKRKMLLQADNAEKVLELFE